MMPCDVLSLAVWLAVGMWADHAGDLTWPDQIDFTNYGPVITVHDDGTVTEHGVWYGHTRDDTGKVRSIAGVLFSRPAAA